MVAYATAAIARQALDTPRLTLGGIAERIGATTAALNGYREGKRTMPLGVRLRLAELLELHAAELEAIAEALREE